MRYVVANWKCRLPEAGCRKWLDTFLGAIQIPADLTVILAPPVVVLESFAAHLLEYDEKNLVLAVQDLSPFPSGGYTGAVSADLVRPMAGYAIAGHPERQTYFRETEQDVINKVEEAVEAGIIPIVCVDGEPGIGRLAPLQDFDTDKVLVALGSERPQNFQIPEAPQRLAAAVAKIHSRYPSYPVLYNGVLPQKPLAQLLSSAGLSGLVAGEESLVPENFAEMCRQLATC